MPGGINIIQVGGGNNRSSGNTSPPASPSSTRSPTHNMSPSIPQSFPAISSSAISVTPSSYSSFTPSSIATPLSSTTTTNHCSFSNPYFPSRSYYSQSYRDAYPYHQPSNSFQYYNTTANATPEPFTTTYNNHTFPTSPSVKHQLHQLECVLQNQQNILDVLEDIMGFVIMGHLFHLLPMPQQQLCNRQCHCWSTHLFLAPWSHLRKC